MSPSSDLDLNKLISLLEDENLPSLASFLRDTLPVPSITQVGALAYTLAQEAFPALRVRLEYQGEDGMILADATYDSQGRLISSYLPMRSPLLCPKSLRRFTPLFSLPRPIIATTARNS